MKAKLAILVLLSSAPWVAAESTVPKLMSYQGRVTDSAGVAIGSTAAVNRAVTFTLYTSLTGTASTDVSYKETQTVTISGGEFSVLIGNGTGVTSYTGPTSPASTIKTLTDVINSATTSALYLGITVDDGNSATQDTEISPRQQLVTGAFAVRALMAESVASGAVTSTMLGDSSVGTNQVATSAINSAKILDGTIAGTDIASSTITKEKIDTGSIGLWAVNGNNINRASNVGIGVTSPGAVLELAARTGTTTTPLTNGLRVANLTNSASNNAVLAAAVAGSSAGSPFVSLALDLITGSNGWSIGVDNVDLDKLVFKNSYDFAANPKMAIDTAGNVGIGTTSPSEKLTVSGGSLRVASTSNPYLAVASVTTATTTSPSVTINQATLGVATSAGSGSSSAAANDAILKSDSAKLILQSGTGAAGIVIDTANKVGIGTTAPVGKLNILESIGTVASAGAGSLVLDHGNTGGTSSILFRSKNNVGSDYAYIQYQDDTNAGGTGEVSRLTIGTANDTDDNIILAPSGKVGIGTTTPLAPLHVAGSTSLTVNQQGYLGAGGAGDCNNQSHVASYGIYCDSTIVAAGFDATSDSRIKTDLQVTDNAADLGVLLGIQITNYHHKDSLMNGNRPQKKVIAQQVESVFPQAVTRKTGIIPDIFTGAKTRDGWVMLATDLKVGDKVRLLADKESPIQEVLEVRVGAFRTAFTPKDADVFVYGREVDDLRSVDYDAIAMLNVSATQELARKLEEKDAVIVALEARLSALEKRVSAAK
jgi:hypothetical protein